MLIKCIIEKIRFIEILLALIHLLSVCSGDKNSMLIRQGNIELIDPKNPHSNKTEACDMSEGRGILLQTVQKEDNYRWNRELNSTDSSDEKLNESLRRACNGKARCSFDSSVKNGSQPANSLALNFVCRPVVPDDNKVFNITAGFIQQITYPGTNKYYLVLEENVTIQYSRCQMSGHNVQIYVTLLHAAFKSNQTLKYKPCHENVADTIDSGSWALLTETLCMSNGTLELSNLTGLVWIEINATQSFTVNCTKPLVFSVDVAGRSTTTNKVINSTSFSRNLKISSENHQKTTSGNHQETTYERSEMDSNASSTSSTSVTRAISTTEAGSSDTATISKSTTDNNIKSESSQRQVTVIVSVVLIAVIVIAVVLAVISVRHRKRKAQENVHQNEMQFKQGDEYDYVALNNNYRNQTSTTAPTTSSQRQSEVSMGIPKSVNRMKASERPFSSKETKDHCVHYDRTEAMYAQVNKVRKSAEVYAATCSPGTTDGSTIVAVRPTLTNEVNEYSHLAHCGEKARLKENHYNG